MKNVLQVLKTHLPKPDATKWSAFEKEIISALPSASKQDYLDVSSQLSQAKAGSEQLWDHIQKEYLRRYDNFNTKDTLALLPIIGGCPYDIYEDVDERLMTSLAYIADIEIKKRNREDPTFESKIDTLIQGVVREETGFTPSLSDDIFDGTNNIKIGLRERRPEDIENVFSKLFTGEFKFDDELLPKSK